jgi:TonB family protein
VPVSLTRGHIKTAEFLVNLHASYSIYLTSQNDAWFSDMNCPAQGAAEPQIRWQAFRSGQLVANGWYSDHRKRAWVGSFETRKGLYNLDLEVLSDGSCLDRYYPVLWVETNGRDSWLLGATIASLYDNVLSLCVTLVIVGIGALISSAAARANKAWTPAQVRPGALGIGHVIRMARRHAKLKQPLSNLPSFGLLGASFFALLLFFNLLLARRTPQGLKVYVPKPGTYARSDEPWNEPLVVRIDARGDLYLNRRPVAGADLMKGLQDALSPRGDWTVFVDGHQGRQYQEIARVVDEIQGAFETKVILVTPGMVEENAMLSKPPFCIPGPREGEKLEVPSPLPARYRSTIRDYPYTSLYGNLLFVVNERGEVSRVRISLSSGFPAIDAWLMRSARKWKYRPMPGCGTQEVDFPFQLER